MNQPTAPAPFATEGPLFLGIDLETSSLDAETGEIREIYAALFDCTLRPMHEIIHTQVQPVSPLVVGVNAQEGALDLHNRTGLFAYWRPMSLRTVEDVLVQHFDNFGLTGQERHSRVHVIGRNPHFDITFLKKKMPYFPSRLHYRTIDVDALELLGSVVTHKTTAAIRAPFAGNHRAKDDVVSTIAELHMFARALAYGRHVIDGSENSGGL